MPTILFAAMWLAAAATPAVPPEGNPCAQGRLVKVWVDERSEGGAAPSPATEEVTTVPRHYGRVVRIAVKCGHRTYAGILPPATADPDGLADETLHFRLKGDQLTILRPGDKTIDLKVAPTPPAARGAVPPG